MKKSRTRLLGGIAVAATAAAMIAPAANAGGTKDPKYAPHGPEQTQQCNATTKSGHDGITRTRHMLGKSGPASFVLVYETEDVPDRIQVFYQGAQVEDTGFIGDDINEGTGSTVVRLPAGTADYVDVVVDGGTGTDWSYTVNCPS